MISPPLAKNLVGKLLKLNPKERISLDEALAHCWFEKNPALRPVLTNILTDPKQILESHLINVPPENVLDQINEIVTSETKKSIVQKTRKNNSQSSHNPELKNIIDQLQIERIKSKTNPAIDK